jgi:hypothetical protein
VPTVDAVYASSNAAPSSQSNLAQSSPLLGWGLPLRGSASSDTITVPSLTAVDMDVSIESLPIPKLFGLEGRREERTHSCDNFIGNRNDSISSFSVFTDDFEERFRSSSAFSGTSVFSMDDSNIEAITSSSLTSSFSNKLSSSTSSISSSSPLLIHRSRSAGAGLTSLKERNPFPQFRLEESMLPLRNDSNSDGSQSWSRRSGESSGISEVMYPSCSVGSTPIGAMIDSPSVSPLVVPVYPKKRRDFVPFRWAPLDQPLCRQMQVFVESDRSFISDNINEICHCAPEMCIEMFGNFLFQHIVTNASPRERKLLLGSIKGKIQEAATDAQGSRSIQKVIEVMDAFDFHSMELLWSCIASNALELCTHPHGNHIIQKVLENFQLAIVEDLIKTIIANIVKLCSQRFSCYVVQRAFDLVSRESPSYRIELIRSLVPSLNEVINHEVVYESQSSLYITY